MAGGMGTRTGPTLAERAASPAAAAPDPAIRHCWVMEPAGSVRHAPGLLLEWRLGPGPEWHGLVTYVPVNERGGGPTSPHLVQRWLPASCLTARP